MDFVKESNLIIIIVLLIYFTVLIMATWAFTMAWRREMIDNKDALFLLGSYLLFVIFGIWFYNLT